MLKKLIFAAVTLSAMGIIGCSSIGNKEHEKICSTLKRQMIFNESNISADVEPASPTNEAMAVHDWQHYQCASDQK